MAGVNDWLNKDDPIRPGYWFRPTRFGLGARPVTWQGWLVALAFPLLLAQIAAATRGMPLVHLGLSVPLALGFVILSWRKTDGEWCWRWGGKQA